MIRGMPALAALILVFALQATASAAESGHNYHATDDPTSLRRNASVSIGGEVRVDYSYRNAKDSAKTSPATVTPKDAELANLEVTGANLRILASVHPNVQAFFKIDLSSKAEVHGKRDEIVEEALLVMSSVGGTGLGFFAGKGRVPYGQDVTLGMLQSYHHIADREDSSEGRIFINEMPHELPGTAAENEPDGNTSLPPMRPGQFDRTFLAGVKYEWQDRWQIELAAFKPNLGKYENRFRKAVKKDGDIASSSIGAAGRVWWRPIEELTVEASAMLVRSHKMGRMEERVDVLPGARGADNAKAVSVGVDYRRGPWRVWGEYQHGWDWNFTKGYSTDAWQVGAAREVLPGVTLAAAAEGLHIDNQSPATPVKQRYVRVAFSAKKSWDNGFFLLAEYGREWRRRKAADILVDRATADFFGVRVGFSF